MSRHTLELDAQKLERFETRSSPLHHWRCFDLPMGEDVYHIHVSRTTPATHTAPARPVTKPELDEVADLIGVLGFMLLKKGGAL